MLVRPGPVLELEIPGLHHKLPDLGQRVRAPELELEIPGLHRKLPDLGQRVRAPELDLVARQRC
jgi:hypothetical protein